MKCIVTAGPTYEPLDAVRRLTNFSTGRLGCELARFLTEHGHDVTLLVGEQATWRGERRAATVSEFGTTSDLREHLRALRVHSADAVFHAAAVSDFAFGKIRPSTEAARPRSIEASDLTATSAAGAADGSARLRPEQSRTGKIPSRCGSLVVELVPTPKIIVELRDWFPKTKLVGWKYELDGSRAEAIEAAQRQSQDCRTDACVVNGRAYGDGFGFVTEDPECLHLESAMALYEVLEQFVLR